MQTSPKMLSSWEKAKKYWASRYGGGLVIFVEEWARVMEAGFLEKKTLPELAIPTANKLSYSNYIYDLQIAVDVLVAYWQYGEELQEWFLSSYGN